MRFVYDITRTYQENFNTGPRFDNPPPTVPDVPRKSFFGYPVNSRLGVSAGLLLNSDWVRAYAERGFDLLTYKTVRSVPHPCDRFPNWVMVNPGTIAAPTVTAVEPNGHDPGRISSAVSFGIPSAHPDEWRKDIEVARRSIDDGQVLIVSVVGTDQRGGDAEALAGDFARCAGWAVESGAQVIEANLSCPNVAASEGLIYRDVNLSASIAAAIQERIGSIPLLLKTGSLARREATRPFLEAVSPFADGVTLVNALRREVRWSNGQPVFGEDNLVAGVVGRALFDMAVEEVRLAAEVIAQLNLDLAIVAGGGASAYEDCAAFLEAGACAVMFGSAPMYLPDLAVEIKRRDPSV